jgi:L-threonylcarbamoyladenylate synthase
MLVPDTNVAREAAAKVIALGGVLGFRTDTFYGLGVDPFNASAVRRIRDLKGREETKPILLLISDPADVERFVVSPSDLFKAVAERFWPGPLTIVGCAQDGLPQELTAGTGTLGIRLPDDDDLRKLVRLCGGALTGTSANPSGSPPARTALEVANYFPSGVELIVDSGEVSASEPSTVVDLSGSNAKLIRVGAVSKSQLAQIVRFEKNNQ